MSKAETILNQLGYYNGRIDGIFGPTLLTSVKSYQMHDGLTADGIVGPLTWGKLESASPSPSAAAAPTFTTASNFLQLGSTGPAVVKLQQLLNAQGYHLAADGVFGALTDTALRNFQASHGITVDGIAGPQTFSLLNNTATASYSVNPPATVAPPAPSTSAFPQMGSVGPEVTKLQQALTAAGFSTQGIDGNFGAHTQAALLAFQQAAHIAVDGIAGPQTWSALNAAVAQHQAEVSRGTVSSQGMAVAGYALEYRGYRYVYGGTSPSQGFDCSGFTQWVFQRFGVSLPRTSFSQWNVGTHISFSQLQPGDLVFFTTDGQFADHVGVYLGNGQFISATTPSQGVLVENINSPYWAHAYDGATRVVN